VGENSKRIKEWQDVFRAVYRNADSNRTPEQMWIAVMAHSSQIGESIRRFAFESLLNSAAHTFSWLCSFVNKCNTLPADDIFSISESLCGIVSLKYPNVCGHCTNSRCTCDPETMEKQKNKSARYLDLLNRRKDILGAHEDYSIKSYQKMFFYIYGGRLPIQTLESVGFHFLEETGEAAVCIRQLSQLRMVAKNRDTEIDPSFLKQLTTVDGIVNNYAKYGKEQKDIELTSNKPEMLMSRIADAKLGLVVEIGDSFSWFCAILNKLYSISNSMYEDPKQHPEVLPSLEAVLAKEYLDKDRKPMCYLCKKNPCICLFYNPITEK
jgi:hypothetical protein